MTDVSEASVPLRRRMRTTAEKRRIVEESLQPGVSVAATARKYELNANVLFGWRRLHRQGLLESCREPALTLLPVEVVTDANDVRPGKAPRVRARAPTPQVASTTAIDIAWPNGTQVRIAAADREVIATVLTLLSR